VYPWLRTCFEYGITQKAQVFIEENGFIRIIVPAKFDWTPGQHVFLRFTGFGLLHAISAHPFTICSSPSMQPNKQSELMFYLRHQGGFTSRLYQHALEQPGASLSVLVDGPYGGINLQKYYEAERLIVIAGGSGAGWCLPFIEQFVRYRMMPADEEHGQVTSADDAKGTIPAERIRGRSHTGPLSLRVVLATRDISSRKWFLQTVDELLSKCSTRDSSSDVVVQVYVTGEAEKEMEVSNKGLEDVKSSKVSAFSTDKVEVSEGGYTLNVPGEQYKGRPEVPLIIQEETSKAEGQSVSVYVCGPITMQNDARNAVAEENLRILKGSRVGGVYLHSEHFSWA
jgi:NAD(P)H-flavin reductase